MRASTLEIEAVTRAELKKLVAVENDFQTAGEHKNELLAFVLVGTLARCSRSELKAIAFHLVAAFGENLNCHAG